VSWHLGRLASFDIESTGVDVESDRIVTVAVLLLGGEQPTETHTWLADPGIDIPEQATAVHGISTAHAREHGRPAPEVLGLVSALLAEQVAERRPIVAMNGRFDFTILDRELCRHGLPSLAEQAGREPFVVDPYVIDKALDKYRSGPRRLVNLAEHYGVKLAAEDAHDAGADALAAARIAYRQAVLYPALQRDLELLHLTQATWAREQAISLAAYFEAKGRPQYVEGAWPLIPRQEENR
jgi:DNA polymerase-3 subunit epsilon